MGTWDEGTLDNDTACDALGDLCHEIVGDIVRFGDTATDLRERRDDELDFHEAYHANLDRMFGLLVDRMARG